MRYGSVFTGIGAADLAFTGLGWTPVFFSEIDPFCNAVLKERFPDVPNLGDVRQITADAVGRLGGIELLVGGPPCQDFSVAGARAGVDGANGQLLGVFAALAGRLRPKWLVMENVPGLLSSRDGRDFGAFLGALAECGYGFAYRVLDAQFAGVPQRRRRVFLVGHLGAAGWRAPAAVLLERESLCGHSPPRRGERESATGTLGGGAAGGGWRIGADEAAAGQLVAATLYSETGKGWWTEGDAGLRAQGGGTPQNVVDQALPLDATRAQAIAFSWQQGDDSKHTGTGRGRSWVARAGDYTGALSTTRQDAIAFNHIQDPVSVNEGSPSLTQDGGAVAYGVSENQRAETRLTDYARQDATGGDKPGQGYPAALQGTTVRRLLPVETERLMGLPDHWTAITYRGKPASDGARYAAIGNSMVTLEVRWIGERIAQVDALLLEQGRPPG